MITIDSSIYTNKNIDRVNFQQRMLVNINGKKSQGYRVSTENNSTVVDVFNYDMAIDMKNFLMNRKKVVDI